MAEDKKKFVIANDEFDDIETTTKKVVIADNEFDDIDDSPKSNAPSSKGVESGAQSQKITPSASVSATDGTLESWTKVANPLANSKPSYEPSNFGEILEKAKIGVINPDLDEIANKSKPMNVGGMEVSVKGGEAPPMALNVPKKEVEQDIDLLTKRTNVVRKMREQEIDKANQFKTGLEQLQQKGQQLNEAYKANPTPELEAELNQTVKDFEDTRKAYNRAAFAQDVYEKRVLQTSDSIKKLANDKVSDNFYKGVYQGMKGNIDSWEESYSLANLGKAEQIQFAKDQATKAPTQEASGGGGVGEMIGGVIPDVLTAIGFSLAGQPVAGAATVAARQGAQQGAQDFVRAFNEVKAKGLPSGEKDADGNDIMREVTDDEAYDIATRAAGFGAVTGAVEGLVGVAGGGKIISAIANKAKTAGGKVIAGKVLDTASDAAVAGTMQASRNAYDQYQGLDTELGSGVLENMAGELMLSGGMAAVTTPSQYSAAKKNEAKAEIFKAVEESKSNPYELQKLQSNLDVLKNQGMISEIDYNDLNKKADDYIKVVESIPTEVKDKQKAADLILERDELEAKKENVDKAFQKPIDEKINAINDELVVLATPEADLTPTTETAGVVEATPIAEPIKQQSNKEVLEPQAIEQKDEVISESQSNKSDVNIQQPMGESKADVGAVGEVAKEELPKEEVKVRSLSEVAADNIFNETNESVSEKIKSVQSEISNEIKNGIKKWGSKKGYYGEEYGNQSEKEIDIPNYSFSDKRNIEGSEYNKDLLRYRKLKSDAAKLHDIASLVKSDLSTENTSGLKKRLGSIVFNFHLQEKKSLSAKEADNIISELNKRGEEVDGDKIINSYYNADADESQIQQMKNNSAEITNLINTPNETKNTESPADNRQVSQPSKVEGEVNEVGGKNEVTNKTIKQNGTNKPTKVRTSESDSEVEAKSPSQIRTEERKSRSEAVNRALKVVPSDPYTSALQYFIKGGKVNTEELKKFFSKRGKQRGNEERFSAEEFNKRIGLRSDKGRTINDIAHQLWQNFDAESGIESMAFREAVESVLLDFDGTARMVDKINQSNDVISDADKLKLAEDKFYAMDEVPSEFLDEVFGMSEAEAEAMYKIMNTPEFDKIQEEAYLKQQALEEADKDNTDIESIDNRIKNLQSLVAKKQKQADKLAAENQGDMFGGVRIQVFDNTNELKSLTQQIREANSEISNLKDKAKELKEKVVQPKNQLKIEEEQVKPKTAKEIAKEKLDEKRAAFRKAQGLTSGGLNALPEFIDLVKAAINYGFESSKEFLKEFRNDIDTKYSDSEVEAAFNSIAKTESQEKPPIDNEPPSGVDFKLDGEGKEKERSFTNKQFLADKSIPDNVKAAVTEDAIFYNELPNSVSVDVANKIYDLIGANEALNAILDDTNGMSPVVRIVLGQVIIRRAKLQGGSKAEADIVLKAEALLAKKGTEYGQAIQAFSLFQWLSKEGQIMYAKKQRQQEIDAKLKKDEKNVNARKKAVTDINEKVIDEVLEGKVGEVIEETTKIKPKAQSKNYGDKNKIVTKKRYEELKKSLKGKFFSSIVPPPELIELGVYHIEAGSRKFADFSKAVIDDLGTGVKKYLKDLYDKSKSDYESKGGDISDFSNEEEIADVENQDQAEKLAKFIVNRAKQKKQSNDPAKQMISSLLAKVGEKLPKRELEKMSDIDKIALAIKNREEYADVWEKSKVEVETIIDNLKISEEEKEAMRNDLQSYYDEVIGQPFSQTTLNKAVKEGLNELGIDVKDVIRKHYTVADNAKRTLVDKLVMDANLSEADAKYLADKVEREFNRIATERKKTALDKLKKPKDKINPTKKKQVNQLEDEIIALSNLGAFADEDFLKIYADKMGWEQISEQDLKTIGKLAEIVEKEQDGFRRARAVEDLLSFQAKMKGSSLGDVAMSLWYANVLSGPTTQLVNIIANTTNLALNYGMALTKSALTANVKDIKGITKSMLIGFQRGLLEGFSTMQTGYSPIRGKIEVPNTLELVDFKRIMTPANAAKYVRRFMVAADVLTFEAAKEMRAYQLSRKLAREEGSNLPNKKQRQRAMEIMGNTKEKVDAAKLQAQEEYEKRVKAINENPDLTPKEKADAIKTEKKDIKRRTFELIEQQRTKASANIIPKSEEYARRLTYNYTPEGVMGLIAAGVNYITRFKPVKFIIPFTNIIANVANESLNYSPIGFARAATSQGSIGKAIDNMFGTNVIKGNENFDGDSDLRNEMIMKAAFGTLVTAAIFALAGDSDDDEIEITADGYGNYKDNYSLTEKGWQPYSIRVGNKWISYQYTPLMPMLAFIGKIKDGQRYRKEKFNEDYMTKVASAAGSMVKTFFDSTFLSSMNTFLNAVFNENTQNTVEDMIKGFAKTANSFILPNAYTQIAKEVERKMDIPVKDMDNRYYAQILKDIPFARNIFQNKVNALGDDVIPDTDKFISDVKIIDPNIVNENDLWVMLAKNKYPLRTLSYNQFNNDGIYDPIEDKQRVITPEEYYNYMKVKGGTIKQFMIDRYADLSNLDEKQFAYIMDKVKEESTSIAKMSIFDNYYKEEIISDIKDLNLMNIAKVISDKEKADKKKIEKRNKKKSNQ